jgi:hypothetical protein
VPYGVADSGDMMDLMAEKEALQVIYYTSRPSPLTSLDEQTNGCLDGSVSVAFCLYRMR